MPPELEDLVVVDPDGLEEEIDYGTQEVFSWPQTVTLTFPWARTYIDLNRRPDQLPPEDEDGIVKLRTCTGEAVLADSPSPELLDRLLQQYYFPYHAELSRQLASGKFVAALDCHSMARVGPTHSPDPGQLRPLICLGNRHGESAPTALIESLAHCLIESLQLTEQDVAFNWPYCGGYITKHYGGRPIPWIQIELSRGLYLDGGLYQGRLEVLNQRFEGAVRRWLGS